MKSIRLASQNDLEKLVPLVQAYHAFDGRDTLDSDLQQALYPLLEQTALGAIYLIGPPSAPVGYMAIAFSYSIAQGGITAAIDEFFIRDRVRGRGMGREALRQVIKTLAQYNVTQLTVDLSRRNQRAQKFFAGLGFESLDKTATWTQAL